MPCPCAPVRSGHKAQGRFRARCARHTRRRAGSPPGALWAQGGGQVPRPVGLPVRAQGGGQVPHPCALSGALGHRMGPTGALWAGQGKFPAGASGHGAEGRFPVRCALDRGRRAGALRSGHRVEGRFPSPGRSGHRAKGGGQVPRPCTLWAQGGGQVPRPCALRAQGGG